MFTEPQHHPHNGNQRVLAYCHDGVGLGHFHRSLAISERVVKTIPQSTFLLLTGTPYVPMFELPEGVDYVKLPAIAKVDKHTYRGKYLSVPINRVQRCREQILLSTVQSFEPAVLLVDKAPAGVCGELLPALRWLRRNRPETRIIFGMRDIEDDPHNTIQQWAALGAFHIMAECYDEIWVYGMRSVFDVAREYRLPLTIQHKLHFVGYVVQDPCQHTSPHGSASGGVLVTVGGGTDGRAVLETYLAGAAKVLSSHGFRSTVVGGPDLPDRAATELREAAARISDVEWLDFVPCMHCLIRRAGLIVSMGGYNTLCEVVSNHKPAVVIPRTKPRVEQALRADLWSRRAALQVIRPEELSPHALTTRVMKGLENGPRESASDLDFRGLDRVCQRFDRMWGQQQYHTAAMAV